MAGRVWRDDDADGVRDATEPAAAGWRVLLFAPDAAVPTGWGFVAEAFTAADGAYRFDGLADGMYRVRFDPPGVAGVFTPQDQGFDDAADSDADPAGWTAVVTVSSAGVEDIDAGLVLLAPPSPVVSGLGAGPLPGAGVAASPPPGGSAPGEPGPPSGIAPPGGDSLAPLPTIADGPPGVLWHGLRRPANPTLPARSALWPADEYDPSGVWVG